MFDFSFAELLVVATVGLVILGPDDLRKTARHVRGFVRHVRSYTTTIQQQVNTLLDDEELARPVTLIQGDDGKIYQAYDIADIITNDASRAEILPFERKQEL